jgi:hypothetical protein
VLDAVGRIEDRHEHVESPGRDLALHDLLAAEHGELDVLEEHALADLLVLEAVGDAGPAHGLEEARIAIGRLSDMEDVVHHPQQRFITLPTPTGPIDILGPGAITAGDDAKRYGPVPKLDQHGDALREEFGGAATP